MSKSAGFNLVMGILWTIAAIVRHIQNPEAWGVVCILAFAAVLFIGMAIYCLIKDRKRNGV